LLPLDVFKKMEKIINVGIVGYGLSGRYFFAPFIDYHRHMRLSAVVSTQAVAILNAYPGIEVYSAFDQMIANPTIDLIVVASPNHTHFAYAQKALMAGKHVIVEKPFTTTATEAGILIDLANKKRLVLAPFHNRRWDCDFLTVKKIIEEGTLGQLLEFESHFDRYRPLYERAPWKNVPLSGNGILYDLGPHLIDQALALFGLPLSVYADIRTQRTNGEIDDYFDLHLYYLQLKVILKASAFVREPGPRFMLHGRNGTFIKYGLDPQEEHLKLGFKPGDQGYGNDDPKNYGTIHTDINGEVIRNEVKSINGNYLPYFESVYQSIVYGKPLIVKPDDGLNVIRVIETAYRSNKEKKLLFLNNLIT
jgi:scyllo-inositol 2-dehydrogenase (NADP+)